MTQPGATADLTNAKIPGSPFWWLARLSQRLMDRQATYDIRENYVSGNHPLPNVDRRYVRALRHIQQKAKTNYVSLVTQAVTQKLRPLDFVFGPDGEVDEDARIHWKYNDMDYQAPVLIHDAATFGFAFARVSPPDEPGGQPVIAMKSPRRCEIERDPNRPTRTLAGLEFWADESIGSVLAILDLPDATYYFQAEAPTTVEDMISDFAHGGMSVGINRFQIVAAVRNPLGVVALERLDWIPEAGESGLSEGEIAFDIQDRINKTVLDRLVISNSQAYRQRWVAGGPKPKSGSNASKSPWDPGADMVWVSENENTKFGDFAEADIKQILEAVRDDVGDMAAITQTPATALTNRMINVAGDTVEQVLRGHYDKVRNRQDAAGWFFERLQKLCFRYKADERASDVNAETVWHPIEVRPLADIADSFQKFIASGVPLKLAMKKAGIYTNQEIEWAVKEAERLKAEQEAREDEQMDKQLKAKAATKTTPGE